jgi:hypothetical protein
MSIDSTRLTDSSAIKNRFSRNYASNQFIMSTLNAVRQVAGISH